MKLFYLQLIFLFFLFNAQAQTTHDAFLLGNHHPTVSARSMALGNALGALGGDLSTANLNPAGIAIYRRMDISLSFGNLHNNSTTRFGGNQTSDHKNQLLFGGGGIVLSSKIRKRKHQWKAINTSITFNRVSNYTLNFKYKGASQGSRVQAFAQQASGSPTHQLDPYDTWMIYHSYLMDSISTGTYVPNGGISSTNFIHKSQRIRRTGGVNELALSLGANYNNRLYLGATIGIDFLAMSEHRAYREGGNSFDFRSMVFAESRDIKGTGINIKAGLIYRVSPLFRIGLAIHSPTFYHLTDAYNSGLQSAIYYKDEFYQTNYSITKHDPSVIQHHLVTPWVFLGSAGVIIPQKGFISFDVEYTNHSWSSFSLLEQDKTPANNEFMTELNQDIDQTYQGMFKAKIGIEILVNLARIRLGYQLQTSPYKTTFLAGSYMQHNLCAGIGFRWENSYLDVGYVHNFKDFGYMPYQYSNISPVIFGQANTGHLMLTLGVFLNPT